MIVPIRRLALLVSLFSSSVLLFPLASAEPGAPSYAIVVQQEVHQDADWKAVCDALLAKHPGAELVTWKSDLSEALPALSKQHPVFTCFVAPCTKSGPDFVAEVHRITRRFDPDPYADTRWGILTGYDASAALELARFDQAITVTKVGAGTEFAMEMVEQGLWYDELVEHKTVQKLDPAAEPREAKCPSDTTQLLADILTDWKADLFITSGHGFKRGWQIGFRYKSGNFLSEDGKLFGKDTTGKRFEISSTHPRIYMPIGNCLIGCIDDKDAFAIAMMNSVGVKGMIGYTVPTWYGYAGWGILDTFVEQPGRYTLNEAFLANQHALVHRLESAFPGAMKHNPSPGSSARIPNKPSPAGVALGVGPNDARGLLHDRDVVAYYGDPALAARMAPRPCAYEQSLKQDGDIYTLTVTGKRGDKSFDAVNNNGSQRGGRPIIQFLPQRVRNVKVLAGSEWSPLITDDFILVPNPGKGESLTVSFRAETAG